MKRSSLGEVHFACLVMAIAVGGCANSREVPAPDRQTHWMRACSSDVECGPLFCLCGLCTLACERDRDCVDGLEQSSACHAGGSALALALCPAPAEASVCLPPCEAGQDCEGEPPSARVEHGPPIAFSCAEVVAGNPPDGLEVVATSDTIANFDAAGGAVYWAEREGVFRADEDGSNVRVIARTDSQPTTLGASADAVAWTEWQSDSIRLFSVSSDGGEPVELGSVDHPTGDPGAAVALTDEDVFWLASGKVLRSPRAGGETEILADDQGWFVPRALAVGGSHVYFIRLAPIAELFMAARRVSTHGPAQPEDLTYGLISGLSVANDYLYFSTVSESLAGLAEEGDGPAAGIWRMPLAGGAPERLYTVSGEPLLGLGSDSELLFWLELTSDLSLGMANSILWGVPTDGDERPWKVLVGDLLVDRVVVPTASPGHVFMHALCLPDESSPLHQLLLRARVD